MNRARIGPARCCLALVACLGLCSCALRRGPDSRNSTTAAWAADVPPTEPLGAASTNSAGGRLALTVESAIMTALERNISFQIERLGPALSRTEEDIQRAVFDPALSATLSAGKEEEDGRDDASAAGTLRNPETVSLASGLTKALSTGTSVKLSLSADSIGADDNADSEEMSWDVTMTQSLLKGRGAAANLARLRQAQVDTLRSLQELRGAAEALVADVERAYWDCILAERSLEIYERSLAVANRELEEVRERIRVGRVAQTELAAAEAEVASRREQLIEARGTFSKRRLNLIRLVNLSANGPGWNVDLALTEEPELDPVKMDDVEAHVGVALKMRPDLEQARLELRHGELDIVRTRNGLLPKLDLFVTLGGSLYARSFSDATEEEGDTTAYSAGVLLEVPLGNRDAGARYVRAQLSLAQIQAALRNMEQLVQVDVRSAYVDVARTAERVKATKATRELRQKTLDNEQEKFRVGRSTTFLVSQARRDLVANQIAEVEAVIEYRKSLLTLYRLDGSLLTRKGIAVE